MGFAARLDRFQRRHPVVSAPLAVIYKYGDDQGPYLAVIIAFYTFLGIFPLLLLASSILGFVLQGYPSLQQQVLNSALSNFPIIGDQLGRPEGVQGSVGAIVVGSLAALYGALGLGQALQNAMNVAWAVPRNVRGNPFKQRFRSLVLLLVAGIAVLAVTAVSIIGNTTDLFGGFGEVWGWLISLLTIAATGFVMSLLFRLSAARDHSLWAAIPGGLFTAVVWHLLQYAGAAYVTHVLARTSAMNQTFGLVLGLMGLIYAAAIVVVIAIEINVVLARRLYPRALLTPFTDAVDLTDADKRAYTAYARAQRHKGFEKVTVSFEKVSADDESEENPPGPHDPAPAADALLRSPVGRGKWHLDAQRCASKCDIRVRRCNFPRLAGESGRTDAASSRRQAAGGRRWARRAMGRLASSP